MKTPKPPPLRLECRARPSIGLKRQILEGQGFVCLGCEAALEDVEFDHVLALGLGGGNSPDNWAALCPRCHRGKTMEDLRRIAKAKRQRRYHETGAARAKRPSLGSVVVQGRRIAGVKLRTSSFQNGLRRHLNGNVTRRCECPRCRAPQAQSEEDGGEAQQ